MTAPESAPMREDVTQADRDVAEAIVSHTRGYAVRLPNDQHTAIQLAARHRLAHTVRPNAGEVRSAHHALIQAGMHESTNTAIDLIPYDVAVRALRDQALSRPYAGDDYVLPCDVHLPPAIVIRAGCPLSTLKLAMEWEGRPRHFEGNPRYYVPTDAGDEVERVAELTPWPGSHLYEMENSPASMRDDASQTEMDEHGEAMVCTGCGTTRTVAAIRAASATAFTCCPERKMVPIRSAMREGVDRGLVETAQVADAIRSFMVAQSDDTVLLPAIQFIGNRGDLLAAHIAAALSRKEPIR
ncbi:hypothetical protein [Sphingomonas sp. BE137]|uniref:hypothetical protein n=1 Tax=Sphingomonas sp. BE137 TaxID=2817844 RepID=UPI001AE3121D|nr:hypothetical protein [Sphingomonas sp. BE137]MDR6850155.1 hypothetical protein [Sphingomonas sp. BE137]